MEHHAINAKIKAMRAKLLTIEDYRALCRSQPTAHMVTGRGSSSLYFIEEVEKELERVRLFLGDPKMSRLLYNNADYMEEWAYIKKLPDGQNRRALVYIKGTEIDLSNILRLYRLKQYYPEAQIYSQLIPICYRLNKGHIKQMAENPGMAEFAVAVKHTPYGHLFKGQSFESLNIEGIIAREMRNVYSKTKKRYPRSMAAVLGYFFDRREEIHNLNVVMEGTKYKLPPEEILKYLRL